MLDAMNKFLSKRQACCAKYFPGPLSRPFRFASTTSERVGISAKPKTNPMTCARHRVVYVKCQKRPVMNGYLSRAKQH